MIAIIMATYQGESYVRKQLDSLFANTVQDWNLYVFDDGSTDRTVEILTEYATAHPGKIQISINPNNLRSAKNFFSGVRLVYQKEAAEYYMFCDQDDCWDTDKIEVSLKKMQSMERQEGKQVPLLVYTDSRLSDKEDRIVEPSFQKASHYRIIAGKKQKKQDTKEVFAHLLMENTMPGCTQMFNRALVQRVFGAEGMSEQKKFPEGMKMHDWWFGLIAAGFGRIGYVKRATMSYRQHEKNVVGGSGFLSYVKNRLHGFGTIRQSIQEDLQQGEAFNRLYGTELEPEKRKVLQTFCSLQTAGFVRKKCVLVQYHFWKSGLVRNAALFWLL